MNIETILFISCVTDTEMYKKCLHHILNLEVPSHCRLDFIAVTNAKSMASGYNRVIDHPAKYKIYIHQDVYILRKNFLIDLIRLFEKYPQLGLIGMAGCEKIPSNGNWWECPKLFGKVIEYKGDKFTTLTFEEKVDDIKDIHFVEGIDGLLMATQYNVKWRDDILDGFHFYDMSQSIEFRKNNYLVGIPVQIEPWCLHVHNKSFYYIGPYEEQRLKFLNHYKLD